METNNEKIAPVVSLSDWVISIIISFIPLLGIIMLIIWGFLSTDINPNKKNWAKALIVIQLIGIALAVVVYAVFIGAAIAMRS